MQTQFQVTLPILSSSVYMTHAVKERGCTTFRLKYTYLAGQCKGVKLIHSMLTGQFYKQIQATLMQA